MDGIRFSLLLLAALTSLSCMVLLFRGYARTGTRLLLWSAFCFIFLSLNNSLLFIDTIILPTQVDLRFVRHGAALAGITCLIYAFIWETE